MQFATIRPVDGRIHLYAFEKEYNRSIEIGYSLVQPEELGEVLKKFDFIDLVLPAQDVFYFTKKYPPTNKSQLTKIISQEIATETTFNLEEFIISYTQEGVQNEKTVVTAVRKDKIRKCIALLGTDVAEKIRNIIPEQLLLFAENEIETAVFIGNTYIAIANGEGQFVIAGGIESLYTDLRLQFPDMEEEEYHSWLETLGDISQQEELSPDEIRARNFSQKWLKNVVTSAKPWLSNAPVVSWVFSDKLPGNGEAFLQNALEDEKIEYEMTTISSLLKQLSSVSEKNKDLNFAKEEFAYRGGMQFLRIRLFASLIMFVILLATTVVAMQIRLSSLNDLSDQIDKKNKRITKEILGKEYPSLRQAVSIMQKTISGGGKKQSKNLYPYTALSMMEVLFPLIAFKESSIEIKNFSIKNDGKVRLTGESDNLEDINKMVDNLEKLDEISEVSKGQINSRGGKNRFNITFEYRPKQKEIGKQNSKKKKEKKGGKK